MKIRFASNFLNEMAEKIAAMVNLNSQEVLLAD